MFVKSRKAPSSTKTARPSCIFLRPYLLLVPALVFFGAADLTHADVFTVNTTDDHISYGCDVVDCSLREAILDANSNPGLDHIMVPAGTYILTRWGIEEDAAYVGDLDITDPVVILGTGRGPSIIDGSGVDRVFHIIDAGGVVTFNGLVITNGNSNEDGGGIKLRNLIATDTLYLINTTVADNAAAGRGGGVYVVSGSGSIDINIDNSTISGNQAVEVGGGLFTLRGNLIIEGSIISGNHSDQGGGGFDLNVSDLTMIDSTVTGNSTPQRGGGARCHQSHGLISNSTIDSNSGGHGGGLSIGNTSTIELRNCTINGNFAGSPGGAFYVDDTSTMAMHSVTISENQADMNYAVHLGGGTLNLTNSIISGHCLNVGGTVISNGGNLESPSTSCDLNPAFDQDGVLDAMLSPLGDHGGPTQTVRPLSGSPAINNGTSSYCLGDDQRGYTRLDGRCDAGAVELQGRMLF